MTTGKDQSQPSPGDLPDRLDSVLTVVYLVFTGGYAATSGPALLQADLSGEAIYLGRMLLDAFETPKCRGSWRSCCSMNHVGKRACRRMEYWSCWKIRIVCSGSGN